MYHPLLNVPSASTLHVVVPGHKPGENRRATLIILVMTVSLKQQVGCLKKKYLAIVLFLVVLVPQSQISGCHVSSKQPDVLQVCKRFVSFAVLRFSVDISLCIACFSPDLYNTIQLIFDIALLTKVAPSSEVHTPQRRRSNYIAEQLCAKDLLKVPTRRLEVDSNLQPSGCKAPNIPLHHRNPAHLGKGSQRHCLSV